MPPRAKRGWAQAGQGKGRAGRAGPVDAGGFPPQSVRRKKFSSQAGRDVGREQGIAGCAHVERKVNNPPLSSPGRQVHRNAMVFSFCQVLATPLYLLSLLRYYFLENI